MKRNKIILPLVAAFAGAGLLSSCEDDVSGIGNTLAKGEVVITIDSVGFDLKGKPVACPVIDARSTTNLLGRISVPEYGDLKCTFVSRLMSITSLAGVGDSIVADSVSAFNIRLDINRGSFTGDSLAPQKLRVYELTKQLPDSITNAFNPEGYYSSSSLLGSTAYSLSAIGSSDSAYIKLKSLPIEVKMPVEKGKEVFRMYREKPEIFNWPKTFAQYFPGIYVEQSFGSGAVANINRVDFNLCYRRGVQRRDTAGNYIKAVKTDTLTVFSTAPEVLSSNNISLTPSPEIVARVERGENIILSPAGYNVEILFPAEKIIESYEKAQSNISVVNDLTLEIPAQKIDNSFGIGVAPYLLMVKTKEMAKFFEENKIPDGKSSFWATYSSKTGGYKFNSMREYLTGLIDSDEPLTEDDVTFTLVPVLIETDKSTTDNTTVISGCVPYIGRPTMCELLLDKAKIKFTYSQQQID